MTIEAQDLNAIGIAIYEMLKSTKEVSRSRVDSHVISTTQRSVRLPRVQLTNPSEKSAARDLSKFRPTCHCTYLICSCHIAFHTKCSPTNRSPSTSSFTHTMPNHKKQKTAHRVSINEYYASNDYGGSVSEDEEEFTIMPSPPHRKNSLQCENKAKNLQNQCRKIACLMDWTARD